MISPAVKLLLSHCLQLLFEDTFSFHPTTGSLVTKNLSKMSKVAVITGCSSGIGLATAKTFLEAGYKVFGIDINTFDTEHLSALPKSVEFFFHQANLTDKDAPKTAIEACKDKFGTVDVLANVAG